MLNLRDNPEPGYLPIFLDVEWLESPTQFVVEVIAEMAKNLPGFRRALREIAGLPGRLLDSLKDTLSELGLYKFKIGLRENIGKEWRVRGKSLLKLAERLDGKFY
jgi:hypothetical protein